MGKITFENKSLLFGPSTEKKNFEFKSFAKI